MLATKFGSFTKMDQGTSLNDEQIYRAAPSVFAGGKHSSRSERYTYIPTIEVLNGLRAEGFLPFSVCQSKTRIEGKADFTKHMIRLRRQDQILAPEANEIVLCNSHDGTSSYQMLCGLFRFVCANGLLIGNTVEDIRVQHRGNIVDNVIDAAYTIVDQFQIANESMGTMKEIQLSRPEEEIFARSALALKYGEESPVSPRQILLPKRLDDGKSDLWTKFNVVQENLMRGGQRGHASSGKRVTTRPVQSIDNNIKLNRALWILADEMARLKA
ncbi:DUF932 domain-containing protein [Desulfosporosinus sp. BICA1-9]|uniref:DUF932 domain-containing protein n=1 Tax=Desulfosporosinus sp. BICA1-9 TaxID=1531958 RepID=UPI00054BD0A9|nr:DUF932 domain-containing protein [Desulfosporosinus sp. BICA1-9]KJS47974.1 MAG: hypothetical protein VR66_16560 [Peptococcaceae bacterium BRH_c23]KJS85184.1 MAG: hypothetical protein JL57_19230 [Desulfosporosinus sp. BICA1-9]HBW38299.1 DUF945 domain-containing protein [Desulfosporosinus sp.]